MAEARRIADGVVGDDRDIAERCFAMKGTIVGSNPNAAHCSLVLALRFMERKIGESARRSTKDASATQPHLLVDIPCFAKKRHLDFF
jgi:hypothetical protein